MGKRMDRRVGVIATEHADGRLQRVLLKPAPALGCLHGREGFDLAAVADCEMHRGDAGGRVVARRVCLVALVDEQAVEFGQVFADERVGKLVHRADHDLATGGGVGGAGG